MYLSVNDQYSELNKLQITFNIGTIVNQQSYIKRDNRAKHRKLAKSSVSSTKTDVTVYISEETEGTRERESEYNGGAAI